MSFKPVVLRTDTVKLEDISLGEQSGWRPLSAKCKAQLLTIFYGGQFGLHCACGVQLLDVQVEGRFLIDDGWSTV